MEEWEGRKEGGREGGIEREGERQRAEDWQRTSINDLTEQAQQREKERDRERERERERERRHPRIQGGKQKPAWLQHQPGSSHDSESR